MRKWDRQNVHPANQIPEGIHRNQDGRNEVFESEEAVEGWLKKPARVYLGRRIPLEYSDTDLGAQEVVNLLGRIKHGVFSS